MTTFNRPGPFTGIDEQIRRIAGDIRAAPGYLQDNDFLLVGLVSQYIDELPVNQSPEKRQEWRQRTASEIIKSGYVTGCTDQGIVMLAVLRALKVGAQYVETFAESWLQDPQRNEKQIQGHAFLDINIDNTWRAFDPTNGLCGGDGYQRGGETYIAVGRGPDFGEVYLRRGIERECGHVDEPLELTTADALREVADRFVPLS